MGDQKSNENDFLREDYCRFQKLKMKSDYCDFYEKSGLETIVEYFQENNPFSVDQQPPSCHEYLKNQGNQHL